MTSQDITLLSFNTSLAPFVWRPYKRIALLANQPAALQADVINLQEVHTYDMLWQLRRHLPHLPYVSYNPSLFGPAAGLVSLARHPIHLDRFMSLSSRKGVLISSFGDLTVTNVHLLANTDGDWSVHNKFYPRQKALLAKLNEILAHPAYMQGILSGDFNLAKTSVLYKRFMQEDSWSDAAALENSPTFHTVFLPDGRKPQRVDYVFLRGDINLVGVERVFEKKIKNVYLSNHMGLLTKMAVN